MDDASEWERYTPDTPVTLEELLDYIELEGVEEEEVSVKELIRRIEEGRKA